MVHALIQQLPKQKHLHIVIGAFDGIHLAHQKIIKKAINLAKQSQEMSMILSFEPLPKEFFQAKDFDGRILTSRQKKDKLEQFGADQTIIVDFDQIKDLSEKDFIELFLNISESITIYSGNDFRMGKQHGETYSGNRVNYVKEEEIIIDSVPCRSTEIRKSLLNGNIEIANKLLGYPYTISSHTRHGDKIGRSIQFPTINTIINKQIIPQVGVYFGKIRIWNTDYFAMIYVGKRPSVLGDQLRIESHVTQKFPTGEIAQGTPIDVTFFERIADEKKFPSLDEMKKALQNYKDTSLRLEEKYKYLT